MGLKGPSTPSKVIAHLIWTIVVLAVVNGAGTAYGLMPQIMARVDIVSLKISLGNHGHILDHVELIVTGVVGFILVLDMLQDIMNNSDRKSNNAAHCKSSPVGKGGERCTVEQMKVGGSGSCSVMGGETIAMESYKAKFVINCAGSY